MSPYAPPETEPTGEDMTMTPDGIVAAQEKLQRRAQLQSRLSRVNGAATLADMLALLDGTGLEAGILSAAKQAVTGFLQNAITGLETELKRGGVEVGNG